MATEWPKFAQIIMKYRRVFLWHDLFTVRDLLEKPKHSDLAYGFDILSTSRLCLPTNCTMADAVEKWP